MPSPSGDITHVSDTALLVAAARAVESDQPDAFVRDPFAALLAGDRGMAIFRSMPHRFMMQFGIGARTRFIDELLLEALAAHPIATVLSVGCGLDARPWRLDLPSDLRWIEVDFSDMLDYKESILSGETPRCRRERLTADLNDPGQRQDLYTAAGAAPALMITEGLLMYLPAATVDALAAETAANNSRIAHWICELNTTAFTKAFDRDIMGPLRHVQAPDAPKGEQILDTLLRHGWAISARRSYITDMSFALPRVQRMFGDRPVQPPPFPPDDPSGVLRFAR